MEWCEQLPALKHYQDKGDGDCLQVKDTSSHNSELQGLDIEMVGVCIDNKLAWSHADALYKRGQSCLHLWIFVPL